MIEKELIYKDDARRAVLKANPSIAYCIDNIKTVDAVEVIHGRWIEDYETFVQDNGYESESIHTGFVCSVCGRHSCSIEPYCHCGAKMDGGNNDD